MNQKSFIPNIEKRRNLINNLRQSRLQLQEFGLDLDELLAGIEKEIREKKRNRLAKNKSSLLV